METPTIDINSSACIEYLRILQALTGRMAANSLQCKTWTTTLVSALLVLAIDKGKPNAILVGFLPTIMLMLLDGYYLSLERCFRQRYADFVSALHGDSANPVRIFDISLPPGQWSYIKNLLFCLVSTSVLWFYGGLVIALWISYLVAR